MVASRGRLLAGRRMSHPTNRLIKGNPTAGIPTLRLTLWSCVRIIFVILKLKHPYMRLDSGQIEILDEEMAVILRKKQPWERIAIGFNLWVDAKKMLLSHLSSIHPDWTEEQVRTEVVRRMSHHGAV